MLRVGLIMMMGLVMAAGGVGLGWLAAGQVGDDLIVSSADGGAAGRDISNQVRPTGRDTAEVAPDDGNAARLLVVADRAGTLERELARLRWQLADMRRDCRPQTSDAPASGAASLPTTVTPTIVALSAPHSMIYNPDQSDLEPQAAHRQPVPMPPAFVPDRDPAPVPARVATADQPLPAPPVTARVATPHPPTTPTVSVRPGQTLTVPEAAVQTGDLGFLDGCWVSSPFSNPVNGVASTKVYCFDGSGNGQMNFRGNDGITCSAPIRARWEPGRRLVLEEPRDGICSNYGPWYREATNCAIGADGRAQCNSYEFYRRFNYGTRLTRT